MDIYTSLYENKEVVDGNLITSRQPSYLLFYEGDNEEDKLIILSKRASISFSFL
ncbi:MAG: hypothetical protein QMD43_05205 [Thermodesulfovibrio sp.]|nr:hypothetical protein [Thermodesulfovibrio sp.]